MNDPGAVGPHIRMRLPSLTPLKGTVAADRLALHDSAVDASRRKVPGLGARGVAKGAARRQGGRYQSGPEDAGRQSKRKG